MEKFRKLSLSILISLLIVVFSFLLFFKGDTDVSKSERRKLLKEPSFTVEKVFDKKYFSDYESYLLDQFPFRDKFRQIKAFSNFYILREKDNDKLYFINDNIFKISNNLNEKEIKLGVKKINSIIEKHPEAKAYYYSIILEKNSFDDTHPHFDNNKLEEILNRDIKNAKYINIADSLKLDDYYRTDPHWSQDKIVKVAKKICNDINGEYKALKDSNIESLDGYKGAYFGQLAIDIPSEKMSYIDSKSFEDVEVKGIEKDSIIKAYNVDNFSNIDPYDLFLGGAKSILYIENKNIDSDRELIIFRDSFGSSLAPLLVENYKKITLVDIRYISSKNVDKYIDYKNADVLFIYSTGLLNSGGILR